MTGSTVRVAAVQFSTTLDVDENLDTCIRMIDAAGDDHPQLIVLPEFVNHLSVYQDDEHCRAVAVELDGPFIDACARAAVRAGAFLALAPTVRREDRVTVTSLLIGPNGSVLAANDKQTLMGNERAHLRAGDSFAHVIDAPFARVGAYACMDGVVSEVPRALACRGATILANSLNSFARDEAWLHIPVRALENQLFVVAANKVGPLLPADQVATFSTALGIGEDAFEGAGESQVVGPDGAVIAIGPRRGEAVVTADIDLGLIEGIRAASPVLTRRPDRYAPLSATATTEPSDAALETVSVATVRTSDEITEAADAGASLVVAPEGTALPEGLPASVTVVTTRLDGNAHIGVVHRGGHESEQRQMHHTSRLPEVTELAGEVLTFDGPWGRMAVAIGDDVRVPEYGRLAAVAGANLLAVCHHPQREADVTLGLVERAAENRFVVVASGGTSVDGGAIIDLPADSLWNPARSTPYDGTINHPRLTRSGFGPVIADVHPRRSLAREISRDTDLVDGRPRAVAELLTHA